MLGGLRPAEIPRRAAGKAQRRAAAAYRRLPRRRGLIALRAEQDEGARLLAEALDATARMRVPPEERVWVERIERVRETLNSSTDRILHPLSEWTGDEAHRDGRILDVVGDVAIKKSQPPMWGLLLLKLVRAFRVGTCVELGTGLGISAAFQGAGLTLNGGGRLVTMEALARRAAMARDLLDQLGLGWVDVRAGRFEDLLDGVLDELGTVDLAFIDGNHHEAATIGYFEQVLPFLSEGAVLVFDDIDWSEGMGRAWRTIAADPRIRIAVDLGRAGICLPGGPDRSPVVHAVPL